jgi:hypothetical protein
MFVAKLFFLHSNGRWIQQTLFTTRRDVPGDNTLLGALYPSWRPCFPKERRRVAVTIQSFSCSSARRVFRGAEEKQLDQ